jgi:hypothetical protein
MTDIVQRLRHRSIDYAVREGGFTDDGGLLHEAADEIERLRAALEALQRQALQSSVNYPANEWGQEALEMARAALGGKSVE